MTTAELYLGSARNYFWGQLSSLFQVLVVQVVPGVVFWLVQYSTISPICKCKHFLHSCMPPGLRSFMNAKWCTAEPWEHSQTDIPHNYVDGLCVLENGGVSECYTGMKTALFLFIVYWCQSSNFLGQSICSCQ